MGSNKKLGNDFESEFCGLLSTFGFWVHNMAQNAAGQPADVIAVKNGRAYLIDCKVCSHDVFDMNRIESNQEYSMALWKECGNGKGWFALKLSNGDIYMLSDYDSKLFGRMNRKDIEERCVPFDEWVMK